MQVGERVRELREAQGLSVRRLAAKAGFSPSFVSQVEHGQASPSIGSLEKMVGALGVTLGEFFGGDGTRWESEWSKGEVARLSGPSESRLEALQLTLAAGGSSGRHEGERELFAYGVAGEMVLERGEERRVLRAGEGLTIPGGMPYRWVNESGAVARVLTVSARDGQRG